MAVAGSSALFTGIINEHEFYSAHYLAEVFKGDISTVLDHWKELEEREKHGGETRYRAPYERLGAIARDYFAMRDRSRRERNRSKAIAMQREFFQSFCKAMDIPWRPHNRRVNADGKAKELDLPVLAAVPDHASPKLWVLGALDIEKRAIDPLLLPLEKEQFIGDGPQADGLRNRSWNELINDVIFKQDERDRPRWLMLISDRQCILIDRYKWLQNRLLRFDLDEILSCRDTPTLQATAALLHVDSLVPQEGSSLLDNLDENSHRHAFGVSEDLKYALREAIELLGNEAAQQLIHRKYIAYTGESELKPEMILSQECLRYMYRLLFLFYIEARPELKYVPLESEAYRRGYSLDALRDLEMVKLVTKESRRGYFLHESINRLFRLVHEGYRGEQKADLADASRGGGVFNSFTMQRLDSHLFDPKYTPYLSKVKFSNETLQAVIRMMSLTRETSGRGRNRRGRVSYSQLGIGQLGAAYEALLSYRGFFARENLYEVKKEGEPYSELDIGYFVTADEIEQYTKEEKVYDEDEDGHSTLKMHPKGKFIYRLAGRDRQKSASYYTPEALAKSLVKYTLKERLQGLQADDILNLSICEPAMGSASLMNEAVNQLAEVYLTLKQRELGERISQDRYGEELQKVKMHIADRNVYGVDLNPIAVELAELSLWLNAMGSSGAVPWFGYQLFSGNSLVGARREVCRPGQLKRKGAKNTWYWQKPQHLAPDSLKDGSGRQPEQVYHFLLPDQGMAGVRNKDAKQLKPEAFEKIKKWKSQFMKPPTADEITLLQQLSAAVDRLWKEHTDMLRSHRKRAEDSFPIWGQPDTDMYRSSTAEKDQLRSSGIFNNNAKIASPYRLLKLVMDYWCALWFWPLDKVDLLPSRSKWLFELNLLLQGQVYDLQERQFSLPLEKDDDEKSLPESTAKQLFSAAEKRQPLTEDEKKAQEVKTAKGGLHLERLFVRFPRLKLVNELAAKYKFLHWELSFADIFADKGGFDIMLGNPPWVKMEWSGGAVLGDFNPRFVLDEISATNLREQSSEFLEKNPLAKQAWFDELTEIEGMQSYFSASQNYPELKGIKANLYKCFLPQAWRCMNANGNSGFLHPEGIYDDPRGGSFRAEVYPRLRWHLQFHNADKLFPIVSKKTYSINIHGSIRDKVSFQHISNLFSVSTIDACLQHNGEGPVPGLKDEAGKWESRGHKSRILAIDKDTLRIFAKSYDDSSAAVRHASLPVIHSVQLLSVLEKFAAQNALLKDFDKNYISVSMFNETLARDDGVIQRDTKFSKSADELILSGPHIFSGLPLSKTPRSMCEENSHYDVLDLTELPEDYMPRSNYFPACKKEEYSMRIPVIPWSKSKKVTNYYRLFCRDMMNSANERTLISAVCAKDVTHIHALRSYCFKDDKLLLKFAGSSFSVVWDFFVKLSGKGALSRMLDEYPVIKDGAWTSGIEARVLGLTCLTGNYSDLWEDNFSSKYQCDAWTSKLGPLSLRYFEHLDGEWKFASALRTDYDRRQALIELDVLVAMAMELSIDELLTMYNVQFSVMKKNEKETYYDRNGRIVFTPSQGLPGIGLPHRANKEDDPMTITYPDGRVETRPLGWEDIRPAPQKQPESSHAHGYGKPKIPDGSVIHRNVMDDTLPGGPRKKVISYEAPFYLPDREEDYRIAWKVFEQRFAAVRHQMAESTQ